MHKETQELLEKNFIAKAKQGKVHNLPIPTPRPLSENEIIDSMEKWVKRQHYLIEQYAQIDNSPSLIVTCKLKQSLNETREVLKDIKEIYEQRKESAKLLATFGIHNTED